MLWSGLPARSKTSTVLWSSAARKRRFPFRSSPKWSKSPEKPGSGVVATSLSGCFSWALPRIASARKSSEHVASLFFTLSPYHSANSTRNHIARLIALSRDSLSVGSEKKSNRGLVPWAAFAMPTLPPPVESADLSMLPNHGLWLDDDEGGSPASPLTRVPA